MTTTRPPRDRQGRFVNWAGTVRATPRGWHLPMDEDDIAVGVREAVRAGQRVRVVGAGHSWSAIAAPDDGAIAMSLDAWEGIEAVDGDRVRVRGGTRLWRLNALLAERGLALPIVGSIAAQSIAGAIATGTHGSSLVHGNLASGVTALRIVDGRGRVIELDEHDDRLDGARVHLGALGVITQVTLRVVPAFTLAESIEHVPIAEVAPRLHEIGGSAEYVKVWWLPHTPTAQVLRYQRTDDAPTRVGLDRWIDERVVHGAILPRVMRAHRRWPATIPAFNRAIAKVYLDKGRRVGPSDMLLSTPMPVVHRETEAVVPLARGGDAFARVVRLIDDERVRVNFIVEARFVRGDAGWMSPAHGGDVVQLGAYMSETAETDRYFAAFWRELRGLGARPHWGKETAHGADELRALWPEHDRFRQLRDELDPERVFANAFVERVLGP